MERDDEVVIGDFTDPDGDGFMEFNDAAFESDRITTSTYDDNDRILTRTVDDDDNGEDRHTVYDWDDNGASSTVLLGETTHVGLDDQAPIETVKINNYNARGRLAQTDLDDQTTVTTSEFEYDDDGIRVKQTTTVGAGQPSVRHFVFDKRNPTGYAQVIDEFTGDGSGTDDKQFTVGLDVIAQAVEAAELALASNDPRIFLYDAHGSVRQLADKLANVVMIALKEVGGAQVHKIDYEAYGEAINAAISTAVTQLLYSGEFTDAVNNNQYLRARYYDLESGRFSRVDPFAGDFVSPQSLNKYLYGHADPISFSDPSGQVVQFLLPILGGGSAVGAIFAGLTYSQNGTSKQIMNGFSWGMLGGMVLGANLTGPLAKETSITKMLLSGLLTGASYVAVDLYADWKSQGKPDLRVWANQISVDPAQLVVSAAKGFTTGVWGEFLDQVDVAGNQAVDLLIDLVGPLVLDVIDEWVLGNDTTILANMLITGVTIALQHSKVVGAYVESVGIDPRAEEFKESIKVMLEIVAPHIVTAVLGGEVAG